MENRNLDGVYFRIKRGESYDAVCFSDLTEDEQREVLKNKPIDFVLQVAIEMGRRLHEIGDQLDLHGE